ncbi:unnamed protein product [Arctogadus glacialis]
MSVRLLESTGKDVCLLSSLRVVTKCMGVTHAVGGPQHLVELGKKSSSLCVTSDLAVSGTHYDISYFSDAYWCSG